MSNAFSISTQAATVVSLLLKLALTVSVKLSSDLLYFAPTVLADFETMSNEFQKLINEIEY